MTQHFWVICLTTLLPALQATAQSMKPTATPICSLVEQAQNYDGKEVYVDSLLLASQHAVVLTGTPCGRGIYVTYPSGKNETKWRDFYEAVYAKSSGGETAALHVKLKGIFHSRIPHGSDTIRQIEVNEVLDVSFDAASQF
jgi:hypothetical protein